MSGGCDNWNAVVAAWVRRPGLASLSEDCDAEFPKDIPLRVRTWHSDGVIPILLRTVVDVERQRLRDRVIPAFWDSFRGLDASTADMLYWRRQFRSALTFLFEYWTELITDVSCFQEFFTTSPEVQRLFENDSIKTVMGEWLHAMISNSAPDLFLQTLQSILSSSLKCWIDAREDEDIDDDDDGEDEESAFADDEPIDNEEDGDIESLRLLCSRMRSMSLTAFIDDALGTFLSKVVHSRLESKASGVFDSHCLDDLLKWNDQVVCTWLLSCILDAERSHDDPFLFVNQRTITEWHCRLDHYVYIGLARVRAAEIFDILSSYPSSSCAIEDLSECLLKTDFGDEIIKAVRRATREWILVPGAPTSKILKSYVSMIKALRLLDKTGVLLESVSEPIKTYLRQRSDAVRCIVTGLLGDGDIQHELKGTAIVGGTMDGDDSDDAEDCEDQLEWVPDPVTADPKRSSRSRRTADIVSTLVDIYGSKELFVNEYRVILAERLLSIGNSYDTDAEEENLERLKLRFGESSMLSCDVMLHDLQESRRINRNIHSQINSKSELTKATSATILSSSYWPLTADENIALPPLLRDSLDEYSRCYATLKAGRTLKWRPNLGKVDLVIELGDRTKKVECTPAQLAVLAPFEEPLSNQTPVSISLEHVSSTLGIVAHNLRLKLAFWVNKGILRVENDVYSVVECEQGSGGMDDGVENTMDQVTAAGSILQAEQQQEQNLLVYENFILGMLANFPALPLDRIHNSLIMFVQEPQYDLTQAELQTFLSTLVDRGVLSLKPGGYATVG